MDSDDDSSGYERQQFRKEADKRKISREKQKKRKEREAYCRKIRAIYRKKSKKKL